MRRWRSARANAAAIGLLCLLRPVDVAAGESNWRQMPSLPNADGVAGPFVGVHDNALIVAGGANFPNLPRWESDKVWHAETYVLELDAATPNWKSVGALRRPVAYGASVSLPDGVLCIGGNDDRDTFVEVFLLQWNRAKRELIRIDYPSLPEACAYGSAAVMGEVVYLAAGQTGSALSSATDALWALDLSRRGRGGDLAWRRVSSVPGPTRAFNVTIAGKDDRGEDAVYVIGGRTADDDGPVFLRDVRRYTPSTGTWRACADAPRPIMAGAGIGWGRRSLLVLSGDDGALFAQTDTLRDTHPGFPLEAFMYDTVADVWASAGAIPSNQVSTVAVRWGDGILLATGEIRPRVRTPKVWMIHPTLPDESN